MALRETPAAQCTSTFPPSSKPCLMKAMPAGKCVMSTADSTSLTGMVRWDFGVSGGWYGDSAMTESNVFVLLVFLHQGSQAPKPQP